MRGRLPLMLGAFALLGLVGWAWDSTHHEHGGSHGAPITLAEATRAITGSRYTDDGSSGVVEQADCKPQVDDAGGGRYTHFRCDLWFANGGNDNVIVHVLPDSLEFKSIAA